MKKILAIGLVALSFSVQGQEDTPKPVTKHFYSSRVVNSHTTVGPEAKTLDFRINHRFGEISNGAYEFFGLDQAMMRIGFDYGVTDYLALGIGRSTFEKTFDGFVKWRIVQQEEGKGNNPVTLSLVSGMSLNSLKWAYPERTNLFTSRLSYNNQILVSRKFNEKFTLQLMPTMIHRNLIDSFQYKNDVYSMGIALRQKIVPQVTLNVEYFYVFPDQISSDYTHPLSVGIDISTGWHTFQLHVTNATGTFEKAVITQTSNRWDKGQLHFGFNISREFHLGGY